MHHYYHDRNCHYCDSPHRHCPLLPPLPTATTSTNYHHKRAQAPVLHHGHGDGPQLSFSLRFALVPIAANTTIAATASNATTEEAGATATGFETSQLGKRSECAPLSGQNAVARARAEAAELPNSSGSLLQPVRGGHQVKMCLTWATDAAVFSILTAASEGGARTSVTSVGVNDRCGPRDSRVR